MGIQVLAKRKYQTTTDSKYAEPVAENHLNRKFTLDKPNVSSDHRGFLFSQDHRLIIIQQINQGISISILNIALKQQKVS